MFHASRGVLPARALAPQDRKKEEWPSMRWKERAYSGRQPATGERPAVRSSLRSDPDPEKGGPKVREGDSPMFMTCDRCGYRGEGEEFRHIGNVMCCGPLVFRECPSCGNPVICDRQEMREDIENTAREISRRVEAALSSGDTTQAKTLLKDLSLLNQCLNSEALEEYIRSRRREIRRLERNSISP